MKIKKEFTYYFFFDILFFAGMVYFYSEEIKIADFQVAKSVLFYFSLVNLGLSFLCFVMSIGNSQKQLVYTLIGTKFFYLIVTIIFLCLYSYIHFTTIISQFTERWQVTLYYSCFMVLFLVYIVLLIRQVILTQGDKLESSELDHEKELSEKTGED